MIPGTNLETHRDHPSYREAHGPYDICTEFDIGGCKGCEFRQDWDSWCELGECQVTGCPLEGKNS